MFEECIYFNLTTLTRKITKMWQEKFGKLGLSPSQGYLLFAMVEHPDVSQRELSDILELDASTITRFIDNLEHKGLVDKTSRGKGSSLTVTVRGRSAYKKIKKTMDQLFQNMQQHFGNKEFTQFVVQLHNVRKSFREKR